MNQTLIAYIKIALAMAIVGSSVVVGKLVIMKFPVFLASELRFIIASLILLPLYIKNRKETPSIKRKDLFILFLQALTGVFLFNIFMLYGLKLTTAVEAGIITCTIPAIVGVIAFLFLKERFHLQKIIGITLAILGTLVINITGVGQESVNSLQGNVLIFGAVIGEALFIILGKTVSDRISPFTISTIMSVFGLLMFLPFSINESINFNYAATVLSDWLLILYFGIVVTVIAFLLMYQGLSQVPASSAGIFTGVIPISTVLLSYIVLEEKLLVSHYIGILFVVAAIYFISRGSGLSAEKTEVKKTTFSQ